MISNDFKMKKKKKKNVLKLFFFFLMSCHTVCESFACYRLRLGYFIQLLKILDAGSKNRGKGGMKSNKKHSQTM
jgi:hypothetical protein